MSQLDGRVHDTANSKQLFGVNVWSRHWPHLPVCPPVTFCWSSAAS